MELIFPSSIPLLVTLFSLLLFIYHVIKTSRHGHGVLPPKAAGSWPLIGHLNLLSGPKPLHETLGQMADKHGPIFTIQQGFHKSLVVSSSEIAKECFTTNDRVISTRPKAIAMEIMGYNYAMFSLSPYGLYWRELRKIATLELLSNHRLSMIMTPVLESELKSSIKEIYDLWVENKSDSNKFSIDMKRWFGGFTLNLILRIVIGKRRQEGATKTTSFESEKWYEALRSFSKLMGVSTLSDSFPSLRMLDIGGHEKAMKKVAKELDIVAQGWLDECKNKKELGSEKDEKAFMDVMISILEGKDYEVSSSFDADTINKSTCLTFILGGSDTTTLALTTCLSVLLDNNHALKKVRDELDLHVGKQRQVKESDLKNLVYLQAVIKETLRLHPASQLSPPREFMEDCTVAGYYVPAGTRIFFNLWKIQRDPQVWQNPLEFRPERFLTTHKDVDVRGQDFDLLPFGSGRRVCPAISFALEVVQFTIASLIHGFEFYTTSDEAVDMNESFGFIDQKANNLEVILSPRLSANTYG